MIAYILIVNIITLRGPTKKYIQSFSSSLQWKLLIESAYIQPNEGMFPKIMT